MLLVVVGCVVMWWRAEPGWQPRRGAVLAAVGDGGILHSSLLVVLGAVAAPADQLLSRGAQCAHRTIVGNNPMLSTRDP